MPDGKWFRVGYGIIIFFLIIFLATQVSFIFQPIFVLFQTLFIPIIIAGILYYLTRPFVDFSSKYIPRPLSVLLVFVAGLGIITGLVMVIAPELQRQFNNLVNTLPDLIEDANQMLLSIQASDWFSRISPEEDAITEFFEGLQQNIDDILSTIASQITHYLGVVANILISIIVVPFILFYLLKDGERLPKRILGFLPKRYQDDVGGILDEMDDALSSYIQGQIIVSCFVGVLVFIGYTIIDLRFALILAVVALFTNFIPFIGPWIGTIPGVIVGLLESPFQALLVIIIVVIIQQLESNLIAPQVMGKKLQIHPITIIFLLLFAGRFGGILAMIIAVPTYAVAKVIVSHIYRIIKLRNKDAFE
ncbi:AI-2E family transporter [Alkalibacillus haloalkaliphilus]|uniref:AI-2E family transporter n=1 Tax=Alkalibacillus haloalkaliphilus TaxID=94136 RepID=UPI002935BB95|nr:AI-2E family transporter [Alkalibacillus haloalkaliphilus]MDV2582828.1 AI-2E family transporter [Alkalibacillus haloalkaliphilus]